MKLSSENIFTKTIEVEESDLDQMQHVNNVRYVQWVQDIAASHWKMIAPTSLQDKLAWVVTSHHITYKSPAFLGDLIEIKTYVSESSGVISKRVVEMHNKDTGKLVVKAETSWCLLSRETLKPHRISEEIISIFHH